MSYRDKQGYGIKKENIPASKKEICKDCNKGILFRYFDNTLNCIVVRCQNCSIVRIDPQKKIYTSFKSADKFK